MTVDIEFLIQKEGDFAWLPLESLSVEILVGRYHLIAQTSEADCPIQVHIRHQYVEEGIWQEVVQHQLLQTDSQGRIEVLPPTFLHHGRWIISCSANGNESLANADIDQYCIQLQVLEQETDLDQDWEFLSHSISSQELHLHQADLLTPLQPAHVKSKTAWNNIAPAEETFHFSEEELDLASSSLTEEFATTKAKDNTNQGQTTQNSRPESTIPQLPEIPKDVKPIRLQISPGLVLPPAIFIPESNNIPLPQLPVFPHLSQWKDLSYSELSVALGRLHWSKLDHHGTAIDIDFKSLELQERFLQTLNQLSTPNTVSSSSSPSTPAETNTFEEEALSRSKALIPFTPERES